jgi:hypothetical protein
MTNANLRHIHVVFSKGYFLPQVARDDTLLREPFRSGFRKFQESILQQQGAGLERAEKVDHVNNRLSLEETCDDLGLEGAERERFIADNLVDQDFVLSSPGRHISETITEPDLFFPGIGKLRFDPLRNVTSRILIGKNSQSAGNFRFPNSIELAELVHLPLLVKFRKKINLHPNLNQFLREAQAHRGAPLQDRIAVSHDLALFFHVYPYGLCFIHLALTISAEQGIQTDDLLSVLRALKFSEKQRTPQLQFSVRGQQVGNLSELMDHFWKRLCGKLVDLNNPLTLRTPILDSIRVKPNELYVRKSDFLEHLDLLHPALIVGLYESKDREKWIETLWGTVDRAKLDEKYASVKDSVDRSDTYITRFPWNWALRPRNKSYSIWIDGKEHDRQRVVEKNHIFVKRLNDFILRTMRAKKPLARTAQEITGLLSKQPNWQDLNGPEGSMQSMFGKYRTDLIFTKSTSTLIASDYISGTRQLQLIFQWQLIAVTEIVFAQKLILEYYTGLLKESRSSPAGTTTDQLAEKDCDILHGSLNLPEHLPRHLRKFYYRQIEEIGLPLRMMDFQRLFDVYNLSKKIRPERYHFLEHQHQPIDMFIKGTVLSIGETRNIEFKEIKGGNPIKTIQNTADEYVVAFLNSEGGRIFWGVQDDGSVVGVMLFEEDDLRRAVTDQLNTIRPAISPAAYRLHLHHVFNQNFKKEYAQYVIELVVPAPVRRDVLYFTGSNTTFIKTDSGKKKLTGPEIQDEITRRIFKAAGAA